MLHLVCNGNGTSMVSRAEESGKENVCLKIIPVVVKGQGQHSVIVTNALLDPGSEVSLCDEPDRETWRGWTPEGIHTSNC